MTHHGGMGVAVYQKLSCYPAILYRHYGKLAIASTKNVKIMGMNAHALQRFYDF